MIRRSLPKRPFLYPILDSGYSTNPLQDSLEAIRAGVPLFQIRAKTSTRRNLYDWMRELEKHNVPVIINDYVDVAMVTGAAGVHLGQDDFPVTKARELLPDQWIGVSTHNDSQFVEALSTDADYIAVGPIYDSTTKPGANPALGLEFLSKVRNLTERPIVCIGGITADRIPDVISTGVDGIALISEIYKGPSVYDSLCRLMELLKR